MKKRLTAILLSACLMTAGGLSVYAGGDLYEIVDEEMVETNAANVDTSGELAANAQSAILIELQTGKVLFEKNPDEQREPASITKIMTMALVFEQISEGTLSYEDMVTASQNAKEMGGTQINLDVGEQMNVYDLLMSVAVASANDSSVALAEHVGGGSLSTFVDMMNTKAEELGMENTNFLNPNGLPIDGHLTTARDIALMSRYLLSFEDAVEFTSTDRYPIRSGENEYMMRNSNALVREYDGCIGVKTGYTDAAGHCLSAAATQGEMTLIAVVLGEPDSKTRFAEATALLDYGFETYTLYEPDVTVEEPAPIKVSMGLETEVEVNMPTESILPQVIKRGTEPVVETKIVLEESLTAPVADGQKLGTYQVIMDGETIYEYEYTAKSAVEKRTLMESVRIMFVKMLTL